METLLASRARVELELEPMPLVRGSVVRLGQVFINLLVNAAQAIPPGMADKHQIVVTTTADSGQHVSVSISDTGSGMSPEVMRKIFDPFFTTKPVGSGTGLGLSVCRSIVESFGGEVTVQSTLGAGSTFRVRLPVSDAGSERAGSEPMTAPRARVLVIDDDKLVRTSIARLLAQNHDVVTVNDASAAVAMLEEDAAFDVVFCDLLMPMMTGMQLYAVLAQRRPELSFLHRACACSHASSLLGSQKVSKKSKYALTREPGGAAYKPIGRKACHQHRGAGRGARVTVVIFPRRR